MKIITSDPVGIKLQICRFAMSVYFYTFSPLCFWPQKVYVGTSSYSKQHIQIDNVSNTIYTISGWTLTLFDLQLTTQKYNYLS